MEYSKNLSLDNLTGYDKDGNFHVEQWKDVEGYEGYYQISTFGRIKIMERIRSHGRKGKEKILKLYFNPYHKYYECKLRKNGNQKNCRVNRLVAQGFVLNPLNKPEVNHRDLDKTNNCVWNLEWSTRRENETHYYLTQQGSSRYTGVSWNKKRNKWAASISFNKKTVFLGYYDLEIEAANIYQKAVNDIERGVFIPPAPVFSSAYKGVYWDNVNKKWMAKIRHNKIDYNLGRYTSEQDAAQACQNKLKELTQII